MSDLLACLAHKITPPPNGAHNRVIADRLMNQAPPGFSKQHVGMHHLTTTTTRHV